MTNVTEPQMPPSYGADALHMQFGVACFQLAVGITRRVLSSGPWSGMEPKQVIEWGANYMLSPPTAKALRDMLVEHVERYEALYGRIEVSPITDDKPKVVELTRPTLVSSAGPLQPERPSQLQASDQAGPSEHLAALHGQPGPERSLPTGSPQPAPASSGDSPDPPEAA